MAHSPQDLLDFARDARTRAYAPYSGFAVGAAVEGASGTVYPGANVENASYSLTCCAERVAVFEARLAGEDRLTAVAVVSASEPPATPCGSCRQVLLEFADLDVPVYVGGESGPPSLVTTVGALLPDAYSPRQLLGNPGGRARGLPA